MCSSSRTNSLAGHATCVAAIASSFMDKAIPPDMLILGEVGLTGEVRGVGHVAVRAMEAMREEEMTVQAIQDRFPEYGKTAAAK